MTGPSDSTGHAQADVYRCPGENYTISRAIHLGRLVQGYHGCRNCPWAADTAGLSQRQIRQLAEAHSRPAALSLFYEEGVRSATIDGLSSAQAASIGQAFAHCLSGDSKKIVIASDGRAATAALNAVLCEAVRSSGAAVLDAGPASAASLVRTIEEQQANGGMLIGTPSDSPNGVGIKFWAGTLPVSQGVLLDAIESAACPSTTETQDPRPKTQDPSPRYGPLTRVSSAPVYLDSLRPLYHALRPLRLVLGTSCRPIENYLDDLTQNVSCKIVLRDRPTSRLAEQIESHQAHFAMEIDDDGESCLVWDEQGQVVPAETLLAWIATAIEADCVVLEATAAPALAEYFASAGVRTVVSERQRQAMADAMRNNAATLGGGPSGRIWYLHPTMSELTIPSADALQTLTFMFNLLSRSDRPLSAVIPTF